MGAKLTIPKSETMPRLHTILAVAAAIVCGAVLAQQQQPPEELPSPEGRTELPAAGAARPIRARQRFRPRPVARPPQNRVDVVRQRRPPPVAQVIS